MIAQAHPGQKLGDLFVQGRAVAAGHPQRQRDVFKRGEVVEQSEDYKEGPRAFVEKRKPKWKGE